MCYLQNNVRLIESFKLLPYNEQAVKACQPLTIQPRGVPMAIQTCPF